MDVTDKELRGRGIPHQSEGEIETLGAALFSRTHHPPKRTQHLSTLFDLEQRPTNKRTETCFNYCQLTPTTTIPRCVQGEPTRTDMIGTPSNLDLDSARGLTPPTRTIGLPKCRRALCRRAAVWCYHVSILPSNPVTACFNLPCTSPAQAPRASNAR